jgi:hypothetical protein
MSTALLWGRRARRRRGPALLALAFLLVFGAGEATARGGFSGGGFKMAPSFRPSAPRSFSTTRPSTVPKSQYNWGSKTAPSRSSGSASTPRLAPPAGSTSSTGITASRSLYDTARSKGTLFSSQSEATQAFRRSYGSTYGSTFANEPAARPSWIPATTFAGGRNYNVVYSPVLGGYGYYDSLLGRWILYDALGDAAMAASLMGNHGYYWGAPPVYMSHVAGFLFFSFVLFVIFCVVCIIAAVARSRRRGSGGW